MVDVVSSRGRVRVRVEVTKATNRGTVFMTFHFPESRTNILTGEAVDEFTASPEYKVCAVRLERVGAEAEEGERGREREGGSSRRGGRRDRGPSEAHAHLQ